MKCVCPECGHEFEVSQFSDESSPLRAARREKGITIKEAADALGISPWTVRDLERGKMNPRLSVVKAACKLYGKSVDVLFPEPAEGDESEEEVDFESLAETVVVEK